MNAPMPDEFAELRDKAKHIAQFGSDVFVSFSLMDDYDMKKVAHDAMEVGEAYGKLLAAYDRVVSRCVRQHPETGQWYQFGSPYTPYPDRASAVAALLKESTDA